MAAKRHGDRRSYSLNRISLNFIVHASFFYDSRFLLRKNYLSMFVNCVMFVTHL